MVTIERPRRRPLGANERRKINGLARQNSVGIVNLVVFGHRMDAGHEIPEWHALRIGRPHLAELAQGLPGQAREGVTGLNMNFHDSGRSESHAN